MKRTGLLLALLAALGAGSVQAANGLDLRGTSLYGMIGPSDADYSTSGVGLKLGADYAAGLFGVRELGLTGFYSYSSARNDYSVSGCSRWKINNHALAFGPTFTLPLQGTRFSLQGRGYGSVNFWRVSAGCSAYDDSGAELDLGYGIGASYQLSPTVTLRADWDSIGWRASMLTLGVGVKF
jgi:opacity protein-like surface antigen